VRVFEFCALRRKRTRVRVARCARCSIARAFERCAHECLFERKREVRSLDVCAVRTRVRTARFARVFERAEIEHLFYAQVFDFFDPPVGDARRARGYSLRPKFGNRPAKNPKATPAAERN
jgi:hypothetical protein